MSQSRDEAEGLLREALAHAERHRLSDMRFWIEEIDPTGRFEVPARPARASVSRLE